MESKDVEMQEVIDEGQEAQKGQQEKLEPDANSSKDPMTLTGGSKSTALSSGLGASPDDLTTTLDRKPSKHDEQVASIPGKVQLTDSS